MLSLPGASSRVNKKPLPATRRALAFPPTQDPSAKVATTVSNRAVVPDLAAATILSQVFAKFP